MSCRRRLQIAAAPYDRSITTSEKPLCPARTDCITHPRPLASQDLLPPPTEGPKKSDPADKSASYCHPDAICRGARPNCDLKFLLKDGARIEGLFLSRLSRHAKDVFDDQGTVSDLVVCVFDDRLAGNRLQTVRAIRILEGGATERLVDRPCRGPFDLHRLGLPLG